MEPIKAELARAREASQKRTEITTDRVALEMARVAFSDLRDVLEWNDDGVTLKSDVEISPDAAPAIRELRIDERRGARGGLQRTVQVKLHDKGAALSLLARHLGMIDADRPDPRMILLERLAKMTDDELRALGQRPGVRDGFTAKAKELAAPVDTTATVVEGQDAKT